MPMKAVFLSAALLATTLSLSSSATDPRVREYILPSRILWKSAGPDSSVENAEQLLKPFSGQVTLDNRAACVLKNHGQEPGVLLAFSCAARVAACGARIEEEPARLQASSGVPTFGFYTYGEFARTVGTLGVHNATITALAL